MGFTGKKVLLYAGYIAGYKGVENLIEAFRHLKDNDEYILIIAGGAPNRMKSNIAYQSYLKRIKDRAAEVSKNIVFTGFLPEEKMSLFFLRQTLLFSHTRLK